MYTTIKGRYEKGKLILEETPPADEAEVLVTFTSVNGGSNKTPKFGYGKGTFGELPADFNELLEDLKKAVPNRQFGFAKGIVTYMADDFDEPLEDMKDYM